MKRVSSNVAKILKEAGYPQKVIIETTKIYDEDGNSFHPQTVYDPEEGEIIAPTYFEVWLWLWREKKFDISICFPNATGTKWFCDNESEGYCFTNECDDPEEAIIAAIDYLIDNNLIK